MVFKNSLWFKLFVSGFRENDYLYSSKKVFNDKGKVDITLFTFYGVKINWWKSKVDFGSKWKVSSRKWNEGNGDL